MIAPELSHYEQKASLRAQAKGYCSPILMSSLHEALRQHLEASIVWRRASTVLVYCPMSHEIDLSRWWQPALESNKPLHPDKTWVFPRMTLDKTLTLHRLESITQWHRYANGLCEPAAQIPMEPCKPDLCLLPALGMDRQGYRLGSGYGFYDRWLAGWGAVRPVCLGVIPQGLLHDQLPRDPWDIPLNGWVSEQGLTLL